MELLTPSVDVLGVSVRFRRLAATITVRLHLMGSQAEGPEAQADAALEMLAHVIGKVEGVTCDGEQVPWPKGHEERRDFIDCLGMEWLNAATNAASESLSPTPAQLGK